MEKKIKYHRVVSGMIEPTPWAIPTIPSSHIEDTIILNNNNIFRKPQTQ